METRHHIDAPWYLVVLTGLVVIGSAILATARIGGACADLDLPAVLVYPFPPAMHLAAVVATWDGARSRDLRRLRAAKQGVLAIALILMLLGALTTQLRLDRWDIVPMLIVGLASGAGPLILGLIFFHHRPPTTQHRQHDNTDGDDGKDAA